MKDCVWCSYSVMKAIYMARKGYWGCARLILYDFRFFEHPVRKQCGAYCHVDDELYKELEKVAKEQNLNNFDSVYVDEKAIFGFVG